MGKTLTSLAQILRPIGGGTDEIVAVKLHPNAVSVSEIRDTGKVIFIDNLATVALPRKLDMSAVHKQADMISDTLRTMREQGIFAAQDAALILPSGAVTLRQLNLPYMTPAELAKEGRYVDFWAESEPEIAKIEDAYFNYHVLVSSENDDLTRVLFAYGDSANLRQWSDILLAAHLNPVYLDLEPIALANYRHATLPRDEKNQSQAVLHISENRMELVAFENSRFQTIRLEVNEFDQVLLNEIESVDTPEGDFWEEVGGRLANSLKQAVLYLQEEHDFSTFSVVYISCDSFVADNVLKLFDKHFTLAPVALWNTLDGVTASKSATDFATQISNKSTFASALGTSMRHLGTFGDKESSLFHLSLLPQADTLRRNRQFGVISRSFSKSWVVLFVLLGLWIGLHVPPFLQSQIESRGVDPIRSEANNINIQLESANNQLQQLETQIASIKDVQQRRGRVLLTETLPDLVPSGVELDSFSVQNDTELLITGTGRERENINLFMSELTTSGLVEAPDVSTGLEEASGLFVFELTGTVRRQN